MSALEQIGAHSRCASWRRWLIVLSILALALSLASRYTRTEIAVGGTTTSVSDLSSGAKTQHLLGDGLQWTAPVIISILLVVPQRVVRVIAPVFPTTELYAEDCLYNRPPPSC